MALWGDNKGRFLFAPNALNGASPYIDRMQVSISMPVPFLADGQFASFLDHIQGDIFAARRGHEVRVREGWLFAGKLRIMRSGGGRETNSLNLQLNLNPTRFLQAYNVPNSSNLRQQIFGDARRSLRLSPLTQQHRRLALTSEQTFDTNDNFLTHRDVVHGPIVDWSTRAEEFVRAAYSLVREEIIRSFLQMQSGAFEPHLVPPFDRAIKTLSLIEFYWEYAVDNSVSKVREIAGDFRAVLNDSFETRYLVANAQAPHQGRERNSPFVTGLLGHADIGAKIYAKASQVVRFEVTFKEQPLRTLTGSARTRFNRSARNALRLSQQIDYVAEEASIRSSNFWDEFWARMARSPAPERATLFRLLERLARAAEGSEVSVPELLSMLTEEGGAEAFGRPDGGPDPIRRLRDYGLLTRLTSSSTRRSRYRFRSNLMPLINLLNSSADNAASTIDLGDAQLHQHEERLNVRMRPRRYSRLEDT